MQSKPMKVIKLLFCLFFPFWQGFAQNIESKKDTLFLLFKENGTSMTIENIPPLPIYTYHIGEDLNLYFSTDSNDEFMKWKIAYKKGLDYVRQVHRDTITIEELKKIKLKDIEWLKKTATDYKGYAPHGIYLHYDPVYIVELEELNHRAIITSTQGAEMIE